MRKLFPVLLLLAAHYSTLRYSNASERTARRRKKVRILAFGGMRGTRPRTKKIYQQLKMLLGPDLIYVDFDGKLMGQSELSGQRTVAKRLQPERT